MYPVSFLRGSEGEEDGRELGAVVLLREEHLQARLTQHVSPAEHLDRIDGKHVIIHHARACMSASGTLPPALTPCP